MRRGPTAFFSFALLCVLTPALGGCLIDRSSLVPPSTGMDAGPAPDAFVLPGTDAGPPIEDPDAYVASEIDAYEAPSPDAGLCDQVGEACCGTSCNAALSCSPSGRCDITGCGGVGASCCLDDVCFGTNGCVDGTCAHCGADGEVCCAGATCEGGLACAGDRCGPCGNTGQPCCGGSCRAGECSEGTCRPPPGTNGGACRGSDPRDQCDANLACRGGSCVSCGGSGEPCCPGFQCRSASICLVDYCT